MMSQQSLECCEQGESASVQGTRTCFLEEECSSVGLERWVWSS